ncbi:hypothetical protein E4U21_005263, partial [Claviceps maximensis]
HGGGGGGDGDVLRLDLQTEQDAWRVGQHFYLCFAESSIWQSHPFTPLNAPVVDRGLVKHSYILRAKSGETRKVADLARSKRMSRPPGHETEPVCTPVFLTGGYGEDLLERIDRDANIVCVAGGTGIAFVLPVLLELASRSGAGPAPAHRIILLVWAMRHAHDVDWVAGEMALLRKCQAALGLTISLFATRDTALSGPSEKPADDAGEARQTTTPVKSSSSSSSSADICPCGPKAVCPPGLSVHKTGDGPTDDARRPDLRKLVSDFVASTVSGRTVVFASGPGGMITDLRAIVAGLNEPARVWRGQERYDVDLVCDDRLEW